MASSKQIRDEIMRMTIVVNSNEGQQEIYNLKKANDTLAQSIADLEKQKAALGRRNKANGEEYDKLKQQIKDNTLAMEANRDKMEKLRGELDLSQMTMGQLRKEADLLKRQLKDVIPGTQPAIELQNQLNRVNERMGVVRRGADEASFSFKNLAERFNHYSGLVTAMVAILVGFGISVQSVIDRNNKMADAMSGVEKTTGLARKEVESLTKTFADFDSRTKNIDLLKIAEVGGRLGVAKSEIADFTREVDKAYVALGDSWTGGVDKLADSLGRIASLYGETKDLPIADSINMIGSALNELAAQGASSEQNIADFVARLGSMPPALKPALNTLLGFGSAFEESNINSEIASSGFAKFIRVASNNAEGFAQVMRKPVKEVKELINSDPAEFFLQFSEGLKGLEGTDLSNILDKLKLSDNEVQRVIGAATEKTDRFRDSVELANQAVAEGTSLQDEFNKVNTNAAAIYEKVQKKLASAFTSKVVADFINSTVTLFGQFLGVVEDTNGAIDKYRAALLFLIKVVAVATATFLGMNIVMGVYNGLMKTAYERVIGLTVVEKARNLVTSIGNGLNTLYTAGLGLMGAGYALVTGNTAQAAFAMRGFNAAIAANPIGAVVTLVTLAASAFFLFKSNAEDATDAIKEQTKQTSFLGEVSKRVTDEQAKSVGEFKSKVEPLTKVLKDQNSTLDERKKAYNELIKIAPEFTGTLDAEYRATSRLDSVYASLVDKIKAAAKARALQAALDEEYEKREKVASRNEFVKDQYKKNPGQKNLDGSETAAATIVKNVIADSNKELEVLDGNIDTISKKLADMTIKNSNYDTSKDSEKPAKPKNDNAEKRAQEQHEREMDWLKRKGEESAALARQIQLDIEDAQIEAMENGFQKESMLLDLQEKRKLEEIEKSKIQKSSFDNLQRKIDNAKKEDKELFKALKDSWLKNNEELDRVKKEQEIIFSSKRRALNLKFENENIKDRDEAFQESLKRLKRQENEEIASYSSLQEMKAGLKDRMDDKELSKIRTWEDGKKAVNKIYQQKELEMLANHLQEMASLYEVTLDFEILTEEQKEEVTKRLEEVRDKVAEVAAKKQDLTNGEQGKEGSKLGKLKGGGNTDILGMSPDQWDTFFDNLKTGTDAIGTVGAAIQALQGAFSAYYSFVQAKEQAQMAQIDRGAKVKEKRLKTMLDRGQINQEEYEQQVQLLQEETDKKKAQIEYESAKRQRNFQVAQIIANTAQAIMSIWAQVPKFDFGASATIMTGLVAGLGALQLATVLSTPLPEAPGFEDGFGMDYDMRRQQDGKKFRVTRKPLTSGEVHSPTHFIAGEKGTELVIDSPTYTRFRPEVKSILRNEIAYSRGFEGGYYPYLSQKEPSVEMSASSAPGSSYSDAVIERNTEALNKVAEMKPRAYIVKDMSFAKDIIEVTDEYNSYKNSARK